jgi:hypothetical protein
MALVILLVGLGAVLLATKALRAEADKVQASRRARGAAEQD